jgi:cytochrome c biogenesis protein CcmG, thiol:disulfide interchange protein DsbE
MIAVGARSLTTLMGVRRTYVPIVVLVSLSLVALLIYGVVGSTESTTLDDAVAHGKRPEAPSRYLPRLEGGSAIAVAKWRGKGPVLVNFWASWCDPCKDEAPVLERAHQRLKAAGGTVLGVTVSDQSDDSRAFARRYGITFPNLRDVDDELSQDYDRTGVPETFVVDHTGHIVAMRRGPVDKAFVDDALKLVGA